MVVSASSGARIPDEKMNKIMCSVEKCECVCENVGKPEALLNKNTRERRCQTQSFEPKIANRKDVRTAKTTGTHIASRAKG